MKWATAQSRDMCLDSCYMLKPNDSKLGMDNVSLRASYLEQLRLALI